MSYFACISTSEVIGKRRSDLEEVVSVMNGRTIILLSTALIIATTAGSVDAQVEGTGKLQGRAYFDLADVLSGADEEIRTFSFRRVYFTYDMQLSEKVVGRFRTDIEQDFDGRYRTFIKHAFAEWRTTEQIAVRIGMQGTILFGELQSIWGYRSLAKTMHDYFGIRSSADIGVSAEFDLSETMSLKAMMSNGQGYKAFDDADYHKAYEVQGIFLPLEGLLISVHLGINGFDSPAEPGSEKISTMDVSAGYEGDGFAIGGSIVSQANHDYNPGEDGLGYWLFGRYALPNLPLGALARFDSWDPDTHVDDNTMTFMIIGVDYSAAPGLNIIPNMQWAKDPAGGDSRTFLLTFYWRW